MSTRALSTTIALGRSTAILNTEENCAAILQNCFKQGIGQTADFEIEQTDDCLGGLIEQVIDETYARHSSLAFIDAATMVSPNNTKIMLVGASQRGKTTTSLALCLRGFAQFVCEDISLIDFSEQVILNMVAPFSIREKTKSLFEVNGITKLNLIDGRWYPNRNLYIESDLCVKDGINIVFLLMSPGSETDELRTQAIMPQEAIKFFLPVSNLLVYPDGCEKMLQLIENARVIALNAGSLEQRLRYISAELS